MIIVNLFYVFYTGWNVQNQRARKVLNTSLSSRIGGGKGWRGAGNLISDNAHVGTGRLNDRGDLFVGNAIGVSPHKGGAAQLSTSVAGVEGTHIYARDWDSERQGKEEENSSSSREDHISVVIPALGGDLDGVSPIDDLISSIAGQTQLPKEVIVVMSGVNSTGCARMLAVLSRLPRNVSVRLNCTGQAVLRQHHARNVGVGMVTGGIVSFMDADDMMHREKLEVTARLFRELPQVMSS